MIRPRRKASKTKPHYISKPIFYEYMALSWGCISASWERLFRLDSVIFIILNADGSPLVFSRASLKGMNSGDSSLDWEGALVEFVSGPLRGNRGVFRGGRVEMEIFNRPTGVKASVFDLVRVR